MTLRELSEEYYAGAEALHQRLSMLKRLEAEAEDGPELLLLRDRIRLLSSMWRDMREVAAVTEHYYERNYCRNAKYII